MPPADGGLAMYRDGSSRELVVAFYAALTGRAEVSRAILAGADKHSVALPLAFALAWAESGYDACARNENAASVDRGLFQLNSATFPGLRETEFFDPCINADHGLAYLSFCMQEGENDLVGLAMYNAGTIGVRSGTPLSTLNHVARILSYRDAVQGAFHDYLTADHQDSEPRIAVSG